MQRFVWLIDAGRRQKEVVPRVEGVVADEPINIAMELIGSALQSRIDDGRRMTIFHGHVRTFDPKLLEGIHLNGCSAKLRFRDVCAIECPTGPHRRQAIHVSVDGRASNRNPVHRNILTARYVAGAWGKLRKLSE
jgi:hypothetical protein